MKKRIGILSSSRADYGIYRPLVKKLCASGYYDTEIIAFGTHLSKGFGYTIEEIEFDGFKIPNKIDCIPINSNPLAISKNIGELILRFADLWNNSNYDLVFCLGDRFEMFAAVAAALPFNIPIAHLYGGEATFGAIDDAFRHSITHMCRYHFTSCETYKRRVIELKRSEEGIFNCGALSYDNLRELVLPSKNELSLILRINFNKPFVLTTFHPETVEYEKNIYYAKEISKIIQRLTNFQFLITMPNNDTMSDIIRNEFFELGQRYSHVHVRDSLGTLNYLAAMKHCAFMLGNTSSGFVEASWFPTRVINLGKRQTGRIVTSNIISSEIDYDSILDSVEKIEYIPITGKERIYGKGNSADCILNILNKIFHVS